MNQSKELLALVICDNMFFIYVISGYDTTSQLLGLGKGLAGKKVKTHHLFYEQAKVSNQAHQMAR